MTEILQIDVDAAQRRAERIRFHATNANEAMESLQKLVHTARDLEDHVTLGYASWTAYVTDLFGNEPLRLARDVRRELVAELTEAGMSTRAIAPIVGTGFKTVARDIEAARGVSSDTPELIKGSRPDEAAALMSSGFVESIDDLTVNTRTGEVIDRPVETTEHTVTEKVKTVTGLDGKEYKRPEPRPRESTPVLTGDAAELQNAIATAKAVGQSLASLERFQYERARNTFLDVTWPSGRDEVQPVHRALVSPDEMRRIAEYLTTLANEMESRHEH
ncbi:hypothetical protein [Leucobacter japonicus]|uniref:hypothetical protein n=1 Tax=Leucobacter japonicus TaxID=1461259 RepID=UPI0006A7DF2B|nr:hypothetical protein [Leucobacter japonicus]